jgi:hypothetical protein
MLRIMLGAGLLSVALFVGGCAGPDHPQQVPASALRVSEGDGRVTYTAASDGTAYVYDHGSNRIVWSGPVASGRTITVDPHDDKIMVGDRIAAEKILHTDHHHEIYFHESAIPGHDKVTIERKETVIERPRD